MCRAVDNQVNGCILRGSGVGGGGGGGTRDYQNKKKTLSGFNLYSISFDVFCMLHAQVIF